MSRGSGRSPAFRSGRPSTSKLVSHLCVLGVLVSIAAVGTWGYYTSPSHIPPPTRAAFEEGGLTLNPEPVTLTLYFATEDATRLLPEVREVARDPEVSLPFQAMAELAKGPSLDSNLLATIPPDAHVNGVEVSGEVATVDWTQAFADGHWGGSAGEWLTIQSIVETMSQFAGIKRVQLLVEGKPIETLAGHFEIDHPFPPEKFGTDDAETNRVTDAVGGVVER